MADKAVIEAKRAWLIEATAAFCRRHADDEYAGLCRRLIEKMARKRAVPFLSGQLNIWAAAVVYALGQINFLFDPSGDPHCEGDDVCNFFGANKTTVTNKAKLIRDMFKMGYWDKEFSTAGMAASNPMNDLMEVDGLIVPKNDFAAAILGAFFNHAPLARVRAMRERDKPGEQVPAGKGRAAHKPAERVAPDPDGGPSLFDTE